jgi:hypothetical protein
MSNSGNSVKDDAIREIAATGLTTSYQPLGGVYLRDSFKFWMTNNSNGDIYLSTDGVTDMKKMPALCGRASDDKTNDMFRKQGTQWYIRFSALPATPSGWVAMEVEYV